MLVAPVDDRRRRVRRRRVGPHGRRRPGRARGQPRAAAQHRRQWVAAPPGAGRPPTAPRRPRSRPRTGTSTTRTGTTHQDQQEEHGRDRHRRRPPRRTSWSSRGRAHPELAARGRRGARHRARADVGLRLRERRDLRALRGVGARLRRLRHPEPHRADQRVDHGAPDHGRRAQARLGQADHRRAAVLRLRPPGQEAPRPRADLGPADGRPVQDRGRRPADGRRPAHRRRSRASSTAPSTTSWRCRSSPTTSREKYGDQPLAVVSPDAGRIKVAEQLVAPARRRPAGLHPQDPRHRPPQRDRRQPGRRPGRGPDLRPRRRHDRHRRHDHQGRRRADGRRRRRGRSSPRPTRSSPARRSTGSRTAPAAEVVVTNTLPISRGPQLRQADDAVDRAAASAGPSGRSSRTAR